MIYVTGDLHGEIDRFKSKEFKKLKKNDYLIVCGDFGFLWDGSKQEKKKLAWIGRRRYQVLFIDGTHDNLDLIHHYPESQWNGGKVREISGKLKYLCRGEIFKLENSTIFAFGGGESSDSDLRQNTWWSNELPSLEKITQARKCLEEHDNMVDYIVTHQCSQKIKKFLIMNDHDPNILDIFFDEIREKCSFKKWFFASYHLNKVIPPNEISLYTAVLPINADYL